MTKTKSNDSTDSAWNGPFWFAVLSPVLGILVGFLALLLFYH
jgi:RsiW-degrading membrane proteinase PrsW (M82 family)